MQHGTFVGGASILQAPLRCRPARSARSRGLAGRCAANGEQTVSQSRDVIPDDDEEAMRDSFRHAYRHSAGMPEEDIQIDGMQQFAAAIWDRQRNIPRSGASGPLDHIFESFDQDGDGHLTPAEVAAALRSRHVELTEEICRKFIEASDADSNSTVEKAEFATLVLHMASADLRSRETFSGHWEKEVCDGDDCEISWSSSDDDDSLLSSGELNPVMTFVDGQPATFSSGSRSDSSLDCSGGSGDAA